MHILSFQRSFIGPTETFIYHDLQALQQQAQVSVACLEQKHEAELPFDPVYVLTHSEIRLWRSLMWRLYQRGVWLNQANASFRTQWQELTQKVKPDIVLLQYGFDALKVLHNDPRPKQPVFIHFHGYDASQLLLNPAYCWALQKLAKRPEVYWLTPSRYMKNALEKAGVPVPGARHAVVHYGIELSHFKPERSEFTTRPFRFLQISSFREKKGHFYTLQAFSKLAEANPDLSWELILAGQGEKWDETRELAQALGLQDKVIFPGLVNRDQARDLMNQVNAFVHHSITDSRGDQEGIPNAIMEAMAMGLPVISTLHAGIPELVTEEENGWLVAEKDVPAYAQALYTAIKQTDYRPQSREKVMQEFEREKRTQRLLRLFAAAMNGEDISKV